MTMVEARLAMAALRDRYMMALPMPSMVSLWSEATAARIEARRLLRLAYDNPTARRIRRAEKAVVRLELVIADEEAEQARRKKFSDWVGDGLA